MTRPRWRGGRAAAAAALAACAACGDDPVRVGAGESSEYRRGELIAAIDRFVAAGRTPEAYGALARDVDALRPGMDETVAALAERHLVVLAAWPVEALRDAPPAARAEALGPTVWPVALAPAIEALAPDGWRSQREAAVRRRDGEPGAAYVARLCDGALAVECRHVVPEWQPAVVDAEAIERLAGRARAAVAACDECGDPAWRTAVGRWEALDASAVAARARAEARGATARWPVAGDGAAAWPDDGPLLAIAGDGTWRLDGDELPGPARAAGLAAARGSGATLRVHVPPGARVATLERVVEAAAAAGFADVEVWAREPAYPWTSRGYRFAAAARPRLGRPDDTIQVLLRARDVGAVTGAAAAPARPR